MTSESLRESLSALMDDEAEQLDVRRVLRAGEQDKDVRRRWERYQLARSVMHNEPWHTGMDLSAGIAAALQHEPALSAGSASRWPQWRLQLGRVAVAASVTMAVLVGVRMVNQDPVTDNTMASVERSMPATSTLSLPVPQMNAGAVLAGLSSGVDRQQQARPVELSAWQEQRVNIYLRSHAENHAQAVPQPIPYARAASLDSN